MGKIKEIFKRIIPASYRKIEEEGIAVRRHVDAVSAEEKKLVEEKFEILTKELAEKLELYAKEIDRSVQAYIKGLLSDYNDNLTQYIADTKQKMSGDFENGTNAVIKYLDEVIETNETNRYEQLSDKLKKLSDYSELVDRKFNELKKEVGQSFRTVEGLGKESVWGEVFKDTIQGSEWLLDQTFSLGRWAIGYPCAYVIYRVLNEIHPQNILELGLGQSTKFTSQYVNYYSAAEHIVIEHDETWIEFFSRNYDLPSKTQIIKCPWKFGEYAGFENIREFDGFSDAIKNKKFDFIIIDAPLGGDMPNFARIDVLRVIPECLMESFIIVFDDCNRSGEKNTFNQMTKVLDDHNIKYKCGQYVGEKIVKVICSENWSFAATM